jgi:short-subunit dehydrogenase
MPTSVLITGASSGIGRALAAEMARRGKDLALAARRVEELQTLQEAILEKTPNVRVVVGKLDVTDGKSVFATLEELAGRLGRLDIVVANAGVFHGKRIGTGHFEADRQVVETNLIGAMATVDAAVAYFRKQGGGHVVGISSVAAYRGSPRMAAYCASKAGLAVYLKALRADARRKGIHVTVLYPGFIDTPMNNTLPSRPFLISAEKGARLIADMIERKVKSSTVPVIPWGILAPLMKLLPDALIDRL